MSRSRRSSPVLNPMADAGLAGFSDLFGPDIGTDIDSDMGPDGSAVLDMNRRLYDDTASAVWQLAVYDPAHGGQSFINMGGVGLLRRMIDLVGITTTSHVADLCCGTGAPAVWLADAAGCQVTGVEINPRQAARARDLVRTRNLDNLVTIEQADVTRWRSCRRFDAVLSLDSMMLIADWSALLETIRAALYPKGMFLASTILACELDKSQRQLLWEEDGLISLPSPEVAVAGLRASGLRQVQVLDLNDVALECLLQIDNALRLRSTDIERLEGKNGYQVWREMSALYIDLFRTGRLRYSLLTANSP